jgi:hypothetical protein
MANRGVAAVVPLVAATATSSPVEEAPSLAMRLYEVVAGGLQERAASSAYKLHAGLEAASAGKVAAVAASATALAGGGMAAVRGPLRPDPDHRADKHRPARVERDAGRGDRREAARVGGRGLLSEGAPSRRDDDSRRDARRDGDRDAERQDPAEFGPAEATAAAPPPDEAAAASSLPVPDSEAQTMPGLDVPSPEAGPAGREHTTEFGP